MSYGLEGTICLEKLSKCTKYSENLISLECPSSPHVFLENVANPESLLDMFIVLIFAFSTVS